MSQHGTIGPSDAEHRAASVDGSKQVPLEKEPGNIAVLNIDDARKTSLKKTHNKHNYKKTSIMDPQTEALIIDQSQQIALKIKTIDTNAVSNVDDNDYNKKENTKKETTVDGFSEPWQQLIFDSCSCDSCDSYHCFALRYHSGVGCACKKCNQDETCNFYSNLMNNLDIKATKEENSDKKHTHKVSIGKIEENIIMKPRSNESITSVCSSVVLDPCTTCKPRIIDEHELLKRHSEEILSHRSKDGIQTTKKNQPIPRMPLDEQEHIYTLVREYVRREFQELSHSLRSAVEEIEKANTSQKESNLPSKTDASTSYSTGFVNMIKSFLGINSQSCKTQTNEVNNNEIDSSNANSVKTAISNQNNCNDIVEEVEKQLMDIEVEVSPSINLETSAAKLKAEIMSLPYEEYKQSISRLKRPIKTKLDLLERIKEIYKACSCKVCQCVGVAPEQLAPSPNPRKCNCKPCECDDCHRSKKNQLKPKESTLIRNFPNKCNCKMCNCIKCGDSFAIPCSCKPCECVDCASKLMRMRPWRHERRYVVATVQERPACICSPCGCHECDISGVRSHHMHDMGTDERRHLNCNCDSCNNDNCEQEGADTCICDRHSKLMRKPVVKDTEEYDIRFALGCKKPIHNALTMFASIPNQLTPADYRNNRLLAEESTQYELQDVKASSDATDFWPEHQKVKSCPKLIQEPCDCKPCECIKCQKHFVEGHIAYKRNAINCNCEICDCISSAAVGVSYDIEKKYKYLNGINSRTDICECRPCECIDCQKYLCTNPYQKHVDESNPEIEEEPSSSFNRIEDSNNYISLLQDVSDSNYFIDLILTDKESKNCTNNKQEDPFKPDTFMFLSAVKQNNIVNFSKSHVIRSAIWKPLQLNTVRENNLNPSGYQDTHSKSKLRLDQCSSIEKSKVSCHNSSGYDYPNGSSARTVESCINDVMNFSGFDIPKMRSLKSAVKMKSDNGSFRHSNLISLERIFNTDNNSKLNATEIKTKKSINWRFENSYDCGSDFNKYTCKQSKLDTSCHCDCSGCSCDHIPCLDLGDKMYIRKHEGTQTANCQENKMSDSTVVKEFDCINSCMKIEENGHLDEFQTLQKRANVSFNYTDRSNTFKTIGLNFKQPYKLTDNNSVFRTLQEAKQFSSELLLKLHKYEQANKKFGNIFGKYKTNRGILNNDEMPFEEDSMTESPVKGNKKDIERKKKSMCNISNSLYKNWTIEESLTKETNSIDSLNSDIKKTSLAEKKKSALLEKLEKYEESNKRIEEMAAKYRKMQESAPNDVIDTKVAELHEIDVNLKREPTNYGINNILDKDLTMKSDFSRHRGDDLCYEDNKIPSDCQNVSPLVKTQQKNDLLISNKEEKEKMHQKLKQQFIDFSKMINTVILRCEKQAWTNKRNSELQIQENHESPPLKDTTACNMNEVNTQGEKIQDSLSFAKETLSRDNENTSEHQGQECNDCMCEILDNDHQDHLNDCLCKTLETPETKKLPLFAHHRSSPTITPETKHNILGYAGAASSIATNAKKPDSRKVNISTIRRMSRHTILIVWNVPEDLTNVFGYEVMVEGRTVQKLRSPLRNVAIIAGLPLSNRVLLTIKTLLNDPIAGNRMPCATCIYNTVKLN